MTDVADGVLEQPSTERESESFFDQLELADVQVTRWSGELAGDFPIGGVHEFTAELRGQYRFHNQVFQCRWNVDVPIHSSEGSPVASIEVTVLETFDVPEGPKPPSDAISAFLKSTSLEIAMPYFREALQSMGQKLGLGSIVLGLMHEPGCMPRAVTIQGKRFDGKRRIIQQQEHSDARSLGSSNDGPEAS
ncbi:hypothetical protein ACGFI9_23045 [Micromonospora sp. NPDC048930]|uniref:hypothetical protein n=1 Tax=Micromonospora sp. NPDC048930 TaxID=3364261 RepID=UPI00371B799A